MEVRVTLIENPTMQDDLYLLSMAQGIASPSAPLPASAEGPLGPMVTLVKIPSFLVWAPFLFPFIS